jgi:hypothetical protein
MQELGPAPAAPSTDELIALLENKVKDTIRNEMSEESDPDRVWILYKNFENYIYSRGLEKYASILTQAVLAQTSSAGIGDVGEDPAGYNDYRQKHYAGFKRKFVAVIGNRLANTIAVPNNPNDEEGVRATKSANPASIYIRDKCDLESKFLDQAARIFDFGTTFWFIDWVENGDRYGYRDEPDPQTNETQPLGNAHFQCPKCGAGIPSEADPQAAPKCPQCGTQLGMEHFIPPTQAEVPAPQTTHKVPKGALEIRLLDSNEVAVPLDSTCIDDCDWLRWEREEPKGRLLKQYGQKLRKSIESSDQGHETISSQLGEYIRSAMASPIGLVRPNRPNRWTCVDVWWTPNQYELLDEQELRQALSENFATGARFVFVKGKLIDIRPERLQDKWQECKPEPSPRIMTDALGDEWTETTDIANNTMNQTEQTISRSNLPIFVNANKIDQDAWANRSTQPAEIFGFLPRAGRSLSDELYQAPPVTVSEQIGPFRQQVIQDAKSNTGLEDAIWGGGEPDPTARQTLLKTNQALMQLGTHWTQIRKCLEKTMLKACKLLSQYAEGVIEFTAKKNQFGQFDTLTITTEDLRSDAYHFEADEAIPVNWGQQRDQTMWLLGQGSENPQLLQDLGFRDPLNIFEIKQLLGVPGMHVPQFDAREKGMGIVGELIKAKPVNAPGPPDANGAPTPGPLQSSIQPDWEDDHEFMANLAKSYLLANTELNKTNPDGYKNVQLWGQAQEQQANQPPPKPPVKGTVSLALKAQDIGDPAAQAALIGADIIPPGTPVQAVVPPEKLLPPPGMQPPNGIPAPPAAPPPPVPGPIQ